MIFGRATVYWDTGCSATYHNFERARRRVIERFHDTSTMQHGPANIKRPHTAEILERISEDTPGVITLCPATRSAIANAKAGS